MRKGDDEKLSDNVEVKFYKLENGKLTEISSTNIEFTEEITEIKEAYYVLVKGTYYLVNFTFTKSAGE